MSDTSISRPALDAEAVGSDIARARVDDTPSTTVGEPERVFSRSVVISGIRCVLTYVIFPFVAPIVGITADVGATVGVLIGVVAIAFNVASIRRFFGADHRFKWWASALNMAVIVLLLLLFVVDSQTLLG